MSLFEETCKTSEQLEKFLREPTVLLDTGVWQYPLGDGRTQNFHAGRWTRRWSYDSRSDRRTLLPFVTNDTAVPLEHAKNGKLARSFCRIVNSFKHYISKLRQGQKDLQHQECEPIPISKPNQSEYLLRDGSTLRFFDPEPGPKGQHSQSSHRRWSLNDASEAEDRTIIEIPYESSRADTDFTSLPSEGSFARILRVFSSLITFLFIEISFPLAKLIFLPCRLKRRAKARKVRPQCEKHQETIRQLAEQLEPAVEAYPEGEGPLDFRMWEYAMTELDKREKEKYEFTLEMVLNWIERFLRRRGYKV